MSNERKEAMSDLFKQYKITERKKVLEIKEQDNERRARYREVDEKRSKLVTQAAREAKINFIDWKQKRRSLDASYKQFDYDMKNDRRT